MRNDFIAHSAKGTSWTKKNSKYIARVKLGDGTYRYFYTQAEYDVYLGKEKRRQALNTQDKRYRQAKKEIRMEGDEDYKKTAEQIHHDKKVIDKYYEGENNKTRTDSMIKQYTKDFSQRAVNRGFEYAQMDSLDRDAFKKSLKRGQSIIESLLRNKKIGGNTRKTS